MNEIVIVGGGHAGVQLCAALAAAGQGARVHLVCEEPELPYQRPPLSKSYQKNADEELQWHRGDAWFGEQGITLHRGDAAVAIDRGQRRLTLASGRVLAYAWLVLATGTRARQLPQLPAGLANVHLLRSAADARRLRAAWPATDHLTVLGGGFIGLELAASARALGKAVRVLESAPRLMQRSVSPELSAHVLDVHRAGGIDVRTGIAVGGFEVQGERLLALQAGGERLAVDALLLGIGAVPEQTLASAAGLVCDNGIVVDEQMRTSDPAVLAIGDCTQFPEPSTGRRLRLESVQNANDQARAAAATLLGTPQPYRALPWFWSEQGSMRLQMAGLAPPEGERHRRPGPTAASFSILHYVAGRLVCVESVNAPVDHMAARKLLESGASPDPGAACDPSRPLKSFVPPPPPA
jgi:3-phenylpropionate/trans-cinnamate dioxygenase ferredoxin reductase subunit